jgi:GR25 family glycosyltransferase involved in LPS biosynthesis
MSVEAFYINLIESSARNISMVAEINHAGMSERISRFQAVKLDRGTQRLAPSEAGCLLSHFTLIKNSVSPEKHLLILEDDAKLPKKFDTYINLALENLHPSIDLIFFGSLFNYHDLLVVERWLSLVNKLKLKDRVKNPHNFFFLPGEHWYSAGGHGYLVNQSSKEKLQQYILNSINSGMNEAIDEIYFRGIRMGDLTAKIIFPFVVGINQQLESDKQERNAETQQRLYNVASNVFSIAVSYEEMFRDALLRSANKNLEAFLFGSIATQRLIPISQE